MLFKIIVILFLLSITYNLFRGLYFLVNASGSSADTARSLAWRIGLSVILFLVLIGLKLLGWVEPHTLQEGLHQTQPATEQTRVQDKEDSKSLKDIESENSQDGRIRLAP